MSVQDVSVQILGEPAERRHTARGSDVPVLDVLKPDQLVMARQRLFGRRRLTRWTRALMWGLRIYVLLMLVVVVYQIVITVHGS
jgi:hypothetical protein